MLTNQEHRTNPIRVLFVEDEEDYREIVGEELSWHGFAVLSYADGRSLLDSLGTDVDADVIVLDWRLPNVSGIDVGLTCSQYDIVQLLATNVGRCVTYREIHDCMHHPGFVAGDGDYGYRVNVRSAMMRIRRKFREFDSTFDAIETYSASGYCWTRPARDEHFATSGASSTSNSTDLRQARLQVPVYRVGAARPGRPGSLLGECRINRTTWSYRRHRKSRVIVKTTDVRANNATQPGLRSRGNSAVAIPVPATPRPKQANGCHHGPIKNPKISKPKNRIPATAPAVSNGNRYLGISDGFLRAHSESS